MALPSGYTQLGYLRATGTQYINMFYQPKLFGRVECKFKFHSTGRQMLLASWGSASNLSYVIEKTATNNYNTNASGITKSGSVTTDLNVNQWYELDYNLNQNYITINGNTVATTSGTPTCTRAWYLFASNDADEGVYLKANASIEYLKLYDTSGILIHSYVPAYSEYVNDYGLFDVVDETFHQNDGTGAFQYPYTISATVTPSNSGTVTGTGYYDSGSTATLTAIPNSSYAFEKWVSDKYYKLTAIESTGSQYIKIDNESKVNMRIELDIKPTGTGSDDNAILGISPNSGSGFRLEIVRKANGKYSLYSSGGSTGSYKDFPTASTDDRVTLIYTQTANSQELTDGVNTVSSSFTSVSRIGFYLFSYYGGYRYYGTYILYGAKVYYDNVLARDFIPVMDYTTLTPGLLDLVEMKFYKNLGTGDFRMYESGSGEYVSRTDNPMDIKNISDFDSYTAYFKSVANCRYKVNGTWKNGTMYIKENGTWKSGTPKIKVNGAWKEGG